MSEKFLDVDLNDPRLKDIKVILITANCSRCGVPNPVNFIVSEGEGLDQTQTSSQTDRQTERQTYRQTIATSIVHSKLDYCDSVFLNIDITQINCRNKHRQTYRL